MTQTGLEELRDKELACQLERSQQTLAAVSGNAAPQDLHPPQLEASAQR
jgi:hypothetical protein